MSHLSPEEQAVLTALNNPLCKVFGKARIAQVLSIVARLVVKIADAENLADGNAIMASAFHGAATGELAEAQIRAFPRFTNQQRHDLLAVVQTHYDAQAWRNSGALADAELHTSLRIG